MDPSTIDAASDHPSWVDRLAAHSHGEVQMGSSGSTRATDAPDHAAFTDQVPSLHHHGSEVTILRLIPVPVDDHHAQTTPIVTPPRSLDSAGGRREDRRTIRRHQIDAVVKGALVRLERIGSMSEFGAHGDRVHRSFEASRAMGRPRCAPVTIKVGGLATGPLQLSHQRGGGAHLTQAHRDIFTAQRRVSGGAERVGGSSQNLGISTGRVKDLLGPLYSGGPDIRFHDPTRCPL